jgi:Flp pilus assembly protein TadB
MNKFRALSCLFLSIAFVGIYVIGTPEKIIGAAIIGLGLVPAIFFLTKAQQEEKKLEEWK